MSNSSLVTVTVPSPTKGSRCGQPIDTITIHCTAGNGTAEEIGNIFVNPERKASSNYGVGKDGSIGLYVNESERSCCSNSTSNDRRAITIEVSSGANGDCVVSDAAYNATIDLVADICRRNNIPKLIWSPDPECRRSHSDGCNMTCHRDFNSQKSCPGPYLYSRMPEIAKAVNDKIGAAGPYIVQGNETPDIQDGATGTNAGTGNDCSDQSASADDRVDSDGNFSDSATRTGIAILKALVGFDDDLCDIVEEKLMKLAGGIDNPAALLPIEDGDAAAIASAATEGVKKVIDVSAAIMNGISGVIPDVLASALNCDALKNGAAQLNGIGDEIEKREIHNRSYASAYRDSEANPDTAMTTDSINAALDKIAKDDNDSTGDKLPENTPDDGTGDTKAMAD